MTSRSVPIFLVLFVCACGGDGTVPEGPEPPDEGQGLVLSVEELSFGTVDYPLVATRTVVATNSSTAAITLTAWLTSDSQDVHLTDPVPTPQSVDPGATLRFDVEFGPLRSGPITGSLSFSTVQDEVDAELPISGVGRAPELTVAPADQAEMPGADWRCHRSQEFLLEATGPLPVRIESVSVVGAADPGEWSIESEPLPVLLQPGDLRSVTVEWTPVVPGQGAATLRVDSSDPLHATQTLELLSTAELAPTSVITRAIEPRTDLLLLQSVAAGLFCDPPNEPSYPVAFQLQDLVAMLGATELDFRAAAMGGDDTGLVLVPGSDPKQSEPLVVTRDSTYQEAIELTVYGSTQGGSQQPLASLTNVVESPEFIDGFRRPGALLLIVLFRDPDLWGQEPQTAVGAAEAALDQMALAPDLWSGHLTGSAESPGFERLLDFAVLRSGIVDDELCDSDYLWFLEALVDLAGQPTRFVPLDGLQGMPVSARLNSDPVAGWSWLPEERLFQLGELPASGDALEVTYELPPYCE